MDCAVGEVSSGSSERSGGQGEMGDNGEVTSLDIFGEAGVSGVLGMFVF